MIIRQAISSESAFALSFYELRPSIARAMTHTANVSVTFGEVATPPGVLLNTSQTADRILSPNFNTLY
jgi:hypothetical protein